MEMTELNEMATKHGWKPLDIQENIGLASFSKTLNGNPARINVYMTKMTVATCLTHPKQGKTQLFRKRVGKKLMNKIFENPRVHTQQGYKRKNPPSCPVEADAAAEMGCSDYYEMTGELPGDK